MSKYFRFTIPIAAGLLLLGGYVALQLGRHPHHSPMAGNTTKQTSRTASSELQTKYHEYAALGDSIAAGAGLEYLAHGTRLDDTCGRSKQSYPYLLAQKLHASLTFAACGGATAEHLTSPQTLTDANNPPQLDTIFADGRPDLITLTIGANDMKWIQTISDCYKSTCNTPDKTAVIDSNLTAFLGRLGRDLQDIQHKSAGTPPPVYLTGYYALGSQACMSSIAPNTVTADEVAWLSQQTNKLNTAIIAEVSKHANVKYISLTTADHGLCAAKNTRWMQTLGDPAPFHLTAKGEQALADVLYAHL